MATNNGREMMKMESGKLFKLLVLTCVGMAFHFPFSTFHSLQAQTIMSVRDILPNYGLEAAWVDDTAGVVDYLASQPQDYVELTNLCVSLRTRAQKAINSLENDYTVADSLIWIDSNTVVSDYTIYEYRLRRLAELMGRMSIRYSRLEQQRIAAEKEAARQRALEEARRQQEERDRMADELRSNIDLHHNAIIKATLGTGVSNRTKLAELRDIYYAYLMVYNKYVFPPGHATDEMIMRLDELNSFQNDLIDNLLGQNSLLYQIDNFKNVLKVRCESSNNNDVYRSYTRVFKRTSVPVSFVDVSEYSDYINQLRGVVLVQQRYLQTLDLRATIAAGSDAIAARYGKKYREVVNTYRDVLSTVNQVPAFTTQNESLLFIQSLEEFIEAQQTYIDDYAVLEELAARADSITQGQNRFRDVSDAYHSVEPMLKTIPAFKDAVGAALFDARVEEVRQVQQCYLRVIALRTQIAANDDTLNAARKLSRTLANGYRTLYRAAVLQSQFYNVDRGMAFIGQLESFVETQNLCINTMHKLRVIETNEQTITGKETPYRNMAKAYARVLKSYNGIEQISNAEDLRRYSLQCDNIIEMQEAFIRTMRSSIAEDCDKNLRHETDVAKIRLVVGLN